MSKDFKVNLANKFGKYVNDIITCITINRFNFLRLNLFSDKMMLQFNVVFPLIVGFTLLAQGFEYFPSLFLLKSCPHLFNVALT